jgi:flagellar basal-body rod protein FlgB
MDLNSIPLFSVLTKRMSWLSKRQSVLAQNVANADTPGYRPRDLEKPDFQSLARTAANRTALKATRVGHFTGEGVQMRGDGAGTTEPPVHEASITGNAVVLEEEMMKVGKTRMEYDLATTIYRRHIAMLRMAIRGNR